MSISRSVHTRPVGLCGLHQSSRSAPSIARANKSSGIRGVSPDRSRGTRRSSHPARSTTSMIGPYARIQRHDARRAPQRPRQDDRAQGRHALHDAREKVHVARLERPPVAALLPAGRGLAKVIEDLRVAENPLRARVDDRARHLRARRELHVRDRQRQRILAQVRGQQVPLRAVRPPAGDRHVKHRIRPARFATFRAAACFAAPRATYSAGEGTSTSAPRMPEARARTALERARRRP